MKQFITFLARRRFNYYDTIGTAMTIGMINAGNYIGAAVSLVFWLAASIWAESYAGVA